MCGGAIQNITLQLVSNSFVASGYRDASVTLSMKKGSKRITKVTLAEGSPVVSK